MKVLLVLFVLLLLLTGCFLSPDTSNNSPPIFEDIGNGISISYVSPELNIIEREESPTELDQWLRSLQYYTFQNALVTAQIKVTTFNNLFPGTNLYLICADCIDEAHTFSGEPYVWFPSYYILGAHDDLIYFMPTDINRLLSDFGVKITLQNQNQLLQSLAYMMLPWDIVQSPINCEPAYAIDELYELANFDDIHFTHALDCQSQELSIDEITVKFSFVESASGLEFQAAQYNFIYDHGFDEGVSVGGWPSEQNRNVFFWRKNP